MRDVVLAVCIIVGALVYLYADYNLPTPRIGDPLGPKAFPALIGIGLLLSGLLLLVETHFRRRKAAAAPEGPAEQHHFLTMIGIAVATACYYAAFEPVGYVISTVLYMMALLSWFHRGHLVANLATTAGFTAIAYAVFDRFLGVSMPLGLIGS